MGMRDNSSINTLISYLANHMAKSWHAFKTLYLVLKGEDIRDHFMRKYEDLYDFYITLEDKFAYEFDLNEVCTERAQSTKTYKYSNERHQL